MASNEREPRVEKPEAGVASWEPMRLRELGDVAELVMGHDSVPGGDGKLSIPASTDPASPQALKKPPGQ